jgi:excisionase family DNA binding protein
MSTNSFDKTFDPSAWISQSEAARLRGVTRQAMHRLIQRGKISTLEVGGHVLVSRAEIENFQPGEAGRPQNSTAMTDQTKRIEQLLTECTSEQRHAIFQLLRQEFPIHPIETDLNTEAEIILEAFARDKTGLTFRMMRGVIAQAAFEIEVVQDLAGWEDITPAGDLPYDFMLTDSNGPVKVQVKLQRSKEFRPMSANEAYRRFPKDMYVVETQKTRGGNDAATGESTRSYRFNEFDIIAVAMQPSTLNWNSYMYTVGNWLVPNSNDRNKILKFQPVAIAPNDDWTDNFETCVSWLRSGLLKTINSLSH